MENEPEMMRQQMEETRASLTEKIESLEEQVVRTVHDATAAVSDTVETVKDALHETVATVKESVHETVETVKDAFDVSLQVKRHPWAMMAGSFFVGYLGGCLLSKKSSPDRFRANGESRNGPYAPVAATARWEMEKPAEIPETYARKTSEHSWLRGFETEIGKLKRLALGTAMGLARDLITRSAPEELKPRLTEIADDLTVKLGGEPLKGPILESTVHDSFSAKDADDRRCYSS